MLMVICIAHGRSHTRPLNKSSHNYCCESNEEVKEAEWAGGVLEPSWAIVTYGQEALKSKAMCKTEASGLT